MSLNRPGQLPTKSALINATIKEKKVYTKNGAVTNSTSLNNVLDMFFLAGASRKMSDRQIIDLFIKAFAEDRNLALKCLFWARDIRGGAGERRFFRVIWKYLVDEYPEVIKIIRKYVPRYGRWDDLFFDKKVATLCKPTIKRGLNNNDALLAKWLPRKGKMANVMRSLLDMSPRHYRKRIVSLSKTVEQDMCAKKWDAINYPSVPSVAMNKYRKAFYRNDEYRFTKYIDSVTKGTKKINANVIFPHTLVRALYNGENKKAVEAQWNSLPNYMEGSNDRILPICDTSGSMLSPQNLPMDVSLALGVYISERNEGIFKDAFMTFSAKPEMHNLNGSLYERLMQIRNANAGFNTDLVKSFDLILNAAIQHNVPKDQMPTKVLVISDMEFDSNNTYANQRKYSKDYLSNFEVIKRKFRNSGYTMPTLIFWNVNGRPENVPATKDDRVGLVSGFSPSILKSILKGDIYSPVQLMLRTINSDRYRDIEV
jgi:hypothetical protein